MTLTACSGKRTNNLGIKNGHLAPCPGSPNCVLSMETDSKHAIPPLSYTGDKRQAKAVLEKIIESMDRVSRVEVKPDYLRYEFKTKMFGFVDDVEFYFPDAPQIQVRSASRLGYSDLGVNRKRIEAIRTRFTEMMKQSSESPEKKSN
jgi:uncharacterized protein (DUF1499 family)